MTRSGEGLGDGQEDLVKGGAQIGIAPPGGKGNVHRVARAGALADLVRGAGSRVEGVLVHGLVEHVAALPEHRLRPVPWCTSQSRISTRAAPSARAASAATAALLMKQNPIIRFGSAW
jgi:hypothetical protein